jgi:hypothetical protein
MLFTMAHFPQSNTKVRAPRVSIQGDESVKVNLGSMQVSARLRRLSVTGGLAEFDKNIGPVPLAELAFSTPAGPFSGLVEFLQPPHKDNPLMRPFRFVALDEEHYGRLKTVLRKLFSR